MATRTVLRKTLVAALVAGTTASGCKSIEGTSPSLIPNKALVLSRSLSVPVDALVLAVGAIVVIDPLAPNWHIEQRQLGAGRYEFALTKKRFASGGDGEAMTVLRRRIERIAQEQGYARFDLLEYEEGIESNLPVARRVSRGVVQFGGESQLAQVVRKP